MPETALDLARELPVVVKTPETSPVKPSLTVLEVKKKFGSEAMGFVVSQIKQGGLKIDDTPQEEAIKRQMGVLAAADQVKKPGFAEKGAKYDENTGEYAFLNLKKIEDFVEGKTEPIKDTFELQDTFETLEAIIEQGKKPEAGQTLDSEKAQTLLDELTAHTEVTVAFEQDGQRIETTIAYSQWKTGQLEDGAKIPEDAKATFQLVGKKEKPTEPEGTEPLEGPVKTPEELKAEIGEANGKIAEKAKKFAEAIISSGGTQEGIRKLLKKYEPVCRAYGLALQNPAEDASKVFLRLSAGLKWKFLGDKEKAPTEEKLKSNLIEAVLEVKSDPKVTEGGLALEEAKKIEEALNGLDSSTVASVIQAAISNKEVVDLAKEFEGSEELKEQYKKVAEIFKEEKFRKEFCRRLFGKENLSEEDLSKSFKDATGLDLETKRGGSLLGAAILIFYLYYFIKQQVDDLTAGVVGGGQGGQAH